MSSRVKINMPLLDRDSVIMALKAMKEDYTIVGNIIRIESRDYFYNATLENIKGKYVLTGDSDTVGKEFQNTLTKEYKAAYNLRQKEIRAELLRQAEAKKKADEAERKRIEQERLRLEEELRRIEAERKRYVESQKQQIKEKAKKMGYSIKETEEEGKIKMVLVKRTY